MGPTLLIITVAVWILLLLLGFALIAWPALGKIQMEMGETPTDFITAIYYSGYSLATLGTGDITPQTSTYRLLMVLETILGFSTLTMTLTYFESV
jgi:Ion channel